MEQQRPFDNRDIGHFINAFVALYRKHLRATYLVRRPKDITLSKTLIATYGVERLTEMAEELMVTDDQWISQTDRGIGILVTKASWLDARLAARLKRTAVDDSWENCRHTPRCHNSTWHVVVLAKERGEVV